MNQKIEIGSKLRVRSIAREEETRYLNPADISLPPGYSVEIFAQGLNSPISMQFAEDGSLYIAESGITSENPQILRLFNGNIEFVADGFNKSISGVNYLNGDIYVSHKGYITIIKPDGSRQDIINGLPSNGDYTNSKVVFGPDNKLYFGQGTATNSGVVGLDNIWYPEDPFLHDNPGSYIMLEGQNFVTNNMFTEAGEITYTGAFSPYGIPNMPFEVRKGIVKASSSVLRANLDGTKLELMAWGLRNPFQIKFDEVNRLFAANRGFDVRGSRPIANAPDDFYLVTEGEWYGWPDYTGGEPVTLSRFTPDGGVQPEFLILNPPGIPPRPTAIFPPHSTIAGFDFNYNEDFGPYGDVYIAEFGSLGPIQMGKTTPYAGIGHRISKIDMNTGGVTTFAINKSGFSAAITKEGGLSRPVDVAFGPDGAMYVLDLGLYSVNITNPVFYPNTGVIWRISRSS